MEKSIFHVNSVNLFNDDKLLAGGTRSPKKQFEMIEFRKKSAKSSCCCHLVSKIKRSSTFMDWREIDEKNHITDPATSKAAILTSILQKCLLSFTNIAGYIYN